MELSGNCEKFSREGGGGIKGSEEYRFVKWGHPAQQQPVGPIWPFEKFNTWILKP